MVVGLSKQDISEAIVLEQLYEILKDWRICMNCNSNTSTHLDTAKNILICHPCTKSKLSCKRIGSDKIFMKQVENLKKNLIKIKNKKHKGFSIINLLKSKTLKKNSYNKNSEFEKYSGNIEECLLSNIFSNKSDKYLTSSSYTYSRDNCGIVSDYDNVTKSANLTYNLRRYQSMQNFGDLNLNRRAYRSEAELDYPINNDKRRNSSCINFRVNSKNPFSENLWWNDN
ncbi:hypothetical protein ACR3K2_36740 [Cryptosporidium serpentis]